ncbi:hypothetical protein ACHAXT_000534 [Thalassiosira profunda]
MNRPGVSSSERDRWRKIRAITSFPHRKGGSLANLSFPDSTRVDATSLARSLAFEFGRETADRFGGRLHSAFLEDDAGTASSSGWPEDEVPRYVDARAIISTYRAVVLAPAAFHDPTKVYLRLLQDYALEPDGGTGCRSLVSDAVKMASIAAVSADEIESTSGRLCQSIRRLSSEPVISRDTLIKALEACPEVMANFRAQMVARLTSDQRLDLLGKEEDKALRAFQRQSGKIVGAKRRHFFLRRHIRRVFAAWRLYLRVATHANQRRKREVLRAWLFAVKLINRAQLFTTLSNASNDQARGRRSLQKLLKNVSIMKRIRQCFTSDAEKDMRASLGHLRIFRRKVIARRAFSSWISFCMRGRQHDLAVRWCETKRTRRAFHRFHTYTKSEIRSRKVARRALIQQQSLLKHLEHVEASALTNRAGSSRVQHSLHEKKEQARQQDEARARLKNLRAEQDRVIISEQRSRRRQRVENERRLREEQFKAEWAAKKVEAETQCLKRNESWKLTPEFKALQQKKLKEIQRQLSITQASTSDRERESAITSQGVISYSILDAHLANAGITPDELFRRLDQLASPINSVPFQSALVSCGLVLDAAVFEEIFSGISIAQHNQSKPTDLSVRLEDLVELRRLSATYVAQEGTRWKLYVEPTHQQLVLHNVVSGEQTLERKMKTKRIKLAVGENLQDHELLKVRSELFVERCKAHRAMEEHHAANSIQSLYYQWSGRQQIKKQRWRLERRRLLQLRTRQAVAVMLIQKRFRARHRDKE